MTADGGDHQPISICFPLAGKWVRLSSEERWRRAIRAGDLQPSTPVEVEHGGEVIQTSPASDVPQLRRIFDDLIPTEPARGETIPAPAGPAPATDPPKVRTGRSPAAKIQADKAVVPNPVVPPPAKAAAVSAPSEPLAPAKVGAVKSGQTPQNSTNAAGCLSLIGFLIVASLVARCSNHSSVSTAEGVEGTRYVREDTRAYASTSAEDGGETVQRGETLTVRSVGASDNAEWAHITAGAHAGKYIHASALSAVPAPALSSAQEHFWRVGKYAVAARSEPNSGAGAVDQLQSGAPVHVLGVTADGWAELRLQDFKIAYVRISNLDPGQTADSSSRSNSPRPAAPSHAPPQNADDAPPSQGSAAAPEPDGSRRSVSYQAPITQPDWLRKPTGEDMSRYYPERAQRMNVEGKATISCTVTAFGTLSDCSVSDEDPADQDFGGAAMRMSKLFKMRPMTRDGVPVSGGTVRIPIVFRLPKG